jgi:nucleoside-diphosphate-sugar epimerase
MAASKERDFILVIGASGRTGLFATRYLCAAAVPVIACVHRAQRLPDEPLLARAEVAIADLEQPGTIAPLIDRALHVIYVAGSERRSLSPGAWQLEVEALSSCVETARRSGFHGRWIYVGYSGAGQRGSATWAETRWRELKAEAEQVILSSELNYFVLRTGHVTGTVSLEPYVSVTQQHNVTPQAELPCNVLGFLLTGAALAGVTPRAQVTMRVDTHGFKLQDAVQAFGRLRTDSPAMAAEPTNLSFRRA